MEYNVLLLVFRSLLPPGDDALESRFSGAKDIVSGRNTFIRESLILSPIIELVGEVFLDPGSGRCRGDSRDLGSMVFCIIRSFIWPELANAGDFR